MLLIIPSHRVQDVAIDLKKDTDLALDDHHEVVDEQAPSAEDPPLLISPKLSVMRPNYRYGVDHVQKISFDVVAEGGEEGEDLVVLLVELGEVVIRAIVFDEICVDSDGVALGEAEHC